MKTKDQIADLFKKHIDTLKGMGKTVNYLCCDNASEQGGKLSVLCKERSIQIEYTMPNTPQQNGVVERKIVTDRDRAFAMLLAAQLTEKAWTLLHTEAELTATKLSNLIWNAQINDIPNQKFNQERSNLQLEHLIQFGRIGYITIQKQIKIMD